MRATGIALISAAAAGLGLSSAASAAVISFGAAQNISGPSDVQNNGTVVKAYDVNNAGNLTVNGVNFVSFPGSSSDTQSGFDGTYGGYGMAGQSGDYGTLLTNGVYHDGGPTSVTLTGLTSGTPYQLEVFVNDSRTIASRVETISGDAGGTPGSVQYAAPGGQYIVGTFTADSASQIINFNLDGSNTNNAQVNGLVLSSVAATPEPGTLGVLGVLGGGLLLRRRRVHA